MRRLLAFCILMTVGIPAMAQTYQVIHTFTGTGGDGAGPRGTLVQVGNDLYGTTNGGGDHGVGTVFRIDSSGSASTVYSFDPAADDGSFPAAGLILATDGNLYGTGDLGRCARRRSRLPLRPVGGTATTIHSFDRDSGGWYAGTPVTEGTDGDLYVVTTYGHCDDGTDSCAAIVRMSTSGIGAVTLHTFGPDDGVQPLSPLLQTAADDFVGTTSLGPNGDARVFHMGGSGTVTLVHEFSDDQGRVTVGSLLKGSDGNLYGVAASGGASFHGTIYRIDPDGNFTVLHSFDGTDGAFPEAGLIEASDGFFYGTTESGGAFGLGTLFRMDAAGNVTSLHDFDGTSSGPAGGGPNRPAGSIVPTAALVEGADGSLYGVRVTGGDNQGQGIVFRYTIAGTAPLFCPNAFVRRDQMAVFLLKTEHGFDHVPPDCLGVFPDVTCPSLFANWIEELASEGITAGCGGRRLLPALARHPRADGGLPPQDGARSRLHTARLRRCLPGRALLRHVRRLDRGPRGRRHHGRLRRRQLLPDQPGHASSDGGVPAEGRARLRLRASGLRPPLRRRALPVALRRLDRGALHRRHHRRMRRRRAMTEDAMTFRVAHREDIFLQERRFP